MTIQNSIDQIRQRIDTACHKAGRDPATVHLLAVSKKKPLNAIEEAAAAGQKLFGENYVQEFVGKSDDSRLDIDWHFIGGLQSNKVKYLRGKVAMIHSVDRLSGQRDRSAVGRVRKPGRHPDSGQHRRRADQSRGDRFRVGTAGPATRTATKSANLWPDGDPAAE